ncbi:pyridoxamine 5'-phosphate oxidase family protein [Aedoeadaptatus pacaensis]|uniref:pyridoxamine 5'-phosphate oxidase family protein n=1 Tax=Aedoeadaptatus pacaensis TaxID=1776390 RepID=UPI00083838EC|nr:pyridoxamine 5'-phosphate oxidase family protein [Peptoniphilus pacaensis]
MFRPVKREKQSLSPEEIKALLKRNTWGVLSLYGKEGYPYGVPVNYTYVDGAIVFHSAKSGHKWEAIEANEKASFTVVDASDIVEEEYTTAYGSVIAFGSVERLEGEARLCAFQQMTDALAPHVSREVNEKTVNHCDGADVFRLVVHHLSGKAGRLTPRP